MKLPLEMLKLEASIILWWKGNYCEIWQICQNRWLKKFQFWFSKSTWKCLPFGPASIHRSISCLFRKLKHWNLNDISPLAKTDDTIINLDYMPDITSFWEIKLWKNDAFYYFTSTFFSILHTQMKEIWITFFLSVER